MCFAMTRQSLLKHPRAYVRPMAEHPEHIQMRAAEAAGAVAIYTAEQRADWVRALGPGQVGWVWRLSLLAIPRGGDESPSADFAALAYELGRRVQAGATLIEGASGITSDDKARFSRAWRDAGRRVASGRSLVRRRAVRMGRARGALATANSVVTLLQTTHAAELPMIVALWKSSAYPTREARAEAINAMLAGKGLRSLGAQITIWRALKKLNAI